MAIGGVNYQETTNDNLKRGYCRKIISSYE